MIPRGSGIIRRGNITLRVGNSNGTGHRIVASRLERLRSVGNASFAVVSPVSCFNQRHQKRGTECLCTVIFSLSNMKVPRLQSALRRVGGSVVPGTAFIMGDKANLRLCCILARPVPVCPRGRGVLGRLGCTLAQRV